MKAAIGALFASRKFLLLFTIAIIGGACVIAGKLPLDGYAVFVGGSFTLLAGFIAAEDAAAKSGPKTQTAGGDITNVAPSVAPPAGRDTSVPVHVDVKS